MDSTKTTPHATALHSDWVALQERLGTHEPVLVNGRDLTIADVVAVSLYKAQALLTNDPRDLQLVNDSVSFLDHQLGSGHVIYGVNTGFGGSADTRTQQFERLQSAAVQHLNVGILLEADKTDSITSQRANDGLLRSHALPTPIVKAAMLIRCNSLMRGHSGVRVSVIESVMRLLSLDMIPVVPLRGSISASGDLSTLSYIAGAIEGNPDIFVKAVSEDGKTSTISAHKTLKVAGLEPVRLQAKEGLGITNGTAPSCAAACIAIHQANQLALLTQLLTAMATEALDGTANNYHYFISAVRPHRGQAEVAHNILSFLHGSRISPPSSPSNSSGATDIRRTGLAQDRYALRTAPQWIGPQLEDLLLATRQVATELNSTTDNPLIDVESRSRGQVHHGGNFQAHVLTSAMEKTLLALQNLGRLLFAQSSELINNVTNKGLPPNLSLDDPSASFTCKGFDVNMAAYAAELAYLARPVSAHVQVAEMANQSVNSMALVAARYALEAAEVVALMAATHVYVLCQALDLRCLRLEFGAKVRCTVEDVLRSCFFTGDDARASAADNEVNRTAGTVKEAIMQRWDQLSHLDLPDRCRTAVGESLATVLESLGDRASLEGLRKYEKQMAFTLHVCYAAVRANFVFQPQTRHYISPASRVVYDFVRNELKIPLNRGVQDHPPLQQQQQRRAEVLGTGAGDACERTTVRDALLPEEQVDARSRTLGTMASEIYEALRRGELHDRIMRFCQN
ncbi:L-Aspartase-like protein [Chaetomium strumarium]|uniref:L-Aspartase-like protein n=1 Tax=Chaetomium strumarium TaxID=1170767 RepID=A0AAJ0GTG5_9PEZI|nr:L-Aspartase-like protein [Chaetomium strumarium]